MGARARVLEIVSKVSGIDENGEEIVYLSEEMILEAIGKHKSIKEWAYIKHDKDVITEEDTSLDNIAKGKQKGDKKDAHWHVLLKCPNAVDIEAVARWFGVGLNFIQIKHGKGAFADCLRYLTHEDPKQQDKGKHLYSDDEVKSNIKWREILEKQEEEYEALGGVPQGDKEFFFTAVGRGLMTPAEVEEENPIFYYQFCDKLKRLRKEYVSEKMPVPRYRSNFYITGKSGMGKTQFSKMFARSLVKDGWEKRPQDVFFVVGHKGSRFDGYAGQEVIIWNDVRAVDILTEFNRSGAFNLFEEVPDLNAANIKYGNVILKNRFWILNGIDDRKKFLDELAGEYTDKNGFFHEGEMSEKKQSYRRFPHFFEITEEEIVYAVSRGWLQDTAEFESYQEYVRLTGNVGLLLSMCGGSEKKLQTAASRWLEPAVEGHQRLVGEKFGDKGSLFDEETDVFALQFGIDMSDYKEEDEEENKEEEQGAKATKKNRKKKITKEQRKEFEKMMRGKE